MSPAKKQAILQPLAYSMMLANTTELEKKKVIELIEKDIRMLNSEIEAETFLSSIDTSGLFVEKENQVYGFSHQTFQEFLASAHVLEQKLLNQLLENIRDGWWYETIRLFVAQTDGTPIIKACIANEPFSPNLIELALECREEALKLDPQIAEELEQIISRGIESVR